MKVARRLLEEHQKWFKKLVEPPSMTSPGQANSLAFNLSKVVTIMNTFSKQRAPTMPLIDHALRILMANVENVNAAENEIVIVLFDAVLRKPVLNEVIVDPTASRKLASLLEAICEAPEYLL